MAQTQFWSRTQFATKDFNRAIYYMSTLRDLGLIYFMTSMKDTDGNDIYYAVVNVNSLLAADLVKYHGFDGAEAYTG